MRKFLIIFCVILAYMVLSSKSCGSGEKEDAGYKKAELAKTKVSIKDEFESEDLSRKSLRAFEIKAKQELVDFSDYLGICSDKKVDESFKSQARQMILDMFIYDSVRINNRILDKIDSKYVPLVEFLNLDPASNYISMNFLFNSIKVTEPLHNSDDLNYIGRLSFTRYLKSCSASDTVFSGPLRMEADIYASKVYKAFGADTLQVWSVFLGEIR